MLIKFCSLRVGKKKKKKVRSQSFKELFVRPRDHLEWGLPFGSGTQVELVCHCFPGRWCGRGALADLVPALVAKPKSELLAMT